VQLLTEGRTMKEAAEGLKLTSRTIAFHKYRIMEIHGLKTNAELIQLALSQRTLGARHHAPHPHPSTRGGRSDAPHPPHDARTTGLGAQLYDPQWAQALALLASTTPTSRRGAAGLGQKPEGGAERPQGSRRSPGASVLSPRECWINWNDQTARRSMSDRLLGFLTTGMNPSSDRDADLIDGF